MAGHQTASAAWSPARTGDCGLADGPWDIGIRYNPELVDRDDFFVNAENLFIHGVLRTKEGTCSSLPPLYVAVGRRLGYPLRLVAAKCHYFVRWDDPEGERWNIECTSHGLNCYADEHYLNWPMPIRPEELAGRTFLVSQERVRDLVGKEARVPRKTRQEGREKLAPSLAERQKAAFSAEKLAETPADGAATISLDIIAWLIGTWVNKKHFSGRFVPQSLHVFIVIL